MLFPVVEFHSFSLQVFFLLHGNYLKLIRTQPCEIKHDKTQLTRQELEQGCPRKVVLWTLALDALIKCHPFFFL